MRPSIARLLTPHIYDTLENHPSVLEYDNVKVSNISEHNFTTLDAQCHYLYLSQLFGYY